MIKIYIKEVRPREGYCLEVLLDNGSSIILNLESRLNTIRFGLLSDKDFFNDVNTDGNFIRWDNKIELSINEVFLLVNK